MSKEIFMQQYERLLAEAEDAAWEDGEDFDEAAAAEQIGEAAWNATRDYYADAADYYRDLAKES